MTDLTGRTFGLLTVKSYAGHLRIGSESRRRCLWDCVCNCGVILRMRGDHLMSGNTKSCGCATKALASAANQVHGLSRGAGRRAEYRIWRGMRDRCLNPNTPAYPNYGGRGITVCERWNDAAAFYADMGPRPSPKHTLERLNNEIGYSPENCKWATRKEQSNNTRQNRILTFNGEIRTLTQWAESLGVCVGTIHARIRYGWSVERALSQPVIGRRHGNNS